MYVSFQLYLDLGNVHILRSMAVILLPLNFYPIVGIMVSAGIKALSTARYLHKSVRHFLHIPRTYTDPSSQYFEYKKMTPLQIATFMDEHKYDYHGMHSRRYKTKSIAMPNHRLFTVAFGFAAALLESIPLAGLFFTISNRIGACMWAFGMFHHPQSQLGMAHSFPTSPRQTLKSANISSATGL